MTAHRDPLPFWPRLLSVERAASYLSVSPTTFRDLQIRHQRIGKRVLWDRLDLDRYADRLADQPLKDSEMIEEAAAIERAFLARRNGKN